MSRLRGGVRGQGSLPSVKAVHPGQVTLEGISKSFDVVSSQTLGASEAKISAGLEATRKKLVEQLLADGYSEAVDAVPSGKTLLSLGVTSGRISDRLPEYSRAGTDWNVSGSQLQGQHRTPRLTFARKKGGNLQLLTLRIKGGGQSGVDQTTTSQHGREHESLYSNPEVHVPFHINGRLVGRVEGEWMRTTRAFDGRSIWGGMSQDYAVDEYARTLALHNLVMGVDGKPAGAPMPLRIDVLDEVKVLNRGVQSTLKMEDFLTNPRLLTTRELFLLGYEALRQKERLDARELKSVSEYVSILEKSDPYFKRRDSLKGKYYVTEYDSETRNGIEGLGYFGEGVSEDIDRVRLKAGSAMKRVLGLSTLLMASREDYRIRQMRRQIIGANSKEGVDSVMKLVYSAYDEQLKLPDKAASFSKSGIEHSNQLTSYLQEIHALNRPAADRIVDRFTHNLFRDLGVLHAFGGHFGGVRDADAGAPGGGSAHERNLDLMGNKNDIDADTLIPHPDISNKSYREGEVERLQSHDILLASDCLRTFKSVLTGSAVDKLLSEQAHMGLSVIAFNHGKKALDCFDDDLAKRVYQDHYRKARH
ncbi:MAG: hypothetical protein V1921_02135 [Candidatus Altiarchaeota archaeon]